MMTPRRTRGRGPDHECETHPDGAGRIARRNTAHRCADHERCGTRRVRTRSRTSRSGARPARCGPWHTVRDPVCCCRSRCCRSSPPRSTGGSRTPADSAVAAGLGLAHAACITGCCHSTPIEGHWPAHYVAEPTGGRLPTSALSARSSRTPSCTSTSRSSCCCSACTRSRAASASRATCRRTR